MPSPSRASATLYRVPVSNLQPQRKCHTPQKPKRRLNDIEEEPSPGDIPSTISAASGHNPSTHSPGERQRSSTAKGKMSSPDIKTENSSFTADDENVQAENTESKIAMASRAGKLYDRAVQGRTSAFSVAKCVRAMLKGPEDAASGLSRHVVVVAMGMFRKLWKPESKIVDVAVSDAHWSDAGHEAMCAAGYVGALFAEDIASMDDIRECVRILVTDPDTARLGGLHTMLLSAGDKICKSKNAPYMIALRQALEAKTRTFPLLWDYEAKSWIYMICSAIDEFFDVQRMKRERCNRV